MLENKYIIGIIVVALVGIFVLRACDKKKQADILNTNLKKTEQAAVIINPKTGEVTEIRRDRTNKKAMPVVTKPITGAREIRVSISPEGRVIITARTKGFVFEPGLSLFFSDKLRLGVDVQWYFLKQFGVVTGAGTNTGEKPLTIDGYVGGSYNLPVSWLSDTSLVVGYSFRKQVVVGVRIKF